MRKRRRFAYCFDVTSLLHVTPAAWHVNSCFLEKRRVKYDHRDLQYCRHRRSHWLSKARKRASCGYGNRATCGATEVGEKLGSEMR